MKELKGFNVVLTNALGGLLGYIVRALARQEMSLALVTFSGMDLHDVPQAAAAYPEPDDKPNSELSLRCFACCMTFSVCP